MSKARVLLQMIFWAALVGGACFGGQSGQAQERTASQSGEKSDNSPRARSNGTQARVEKDQTSEYLPSDENQKSFASVRAGTRKPRSALSHAKSPQNRQPRAGKTPATNGVRTETLPNAPDFHQAGSTMPSQVPNRPLEHASTPVPPPTVALNGQQFKNARDPGARMATRGGSVNYARGTAAINGSDIKRRP